ncbi:Pka-R2 [Symbiodinium pilosum]|uniref:Pka-R2 protein n=1 Tax=Symbiodinium pilosum TaxID=2952 RepID=A0A812JMH1_SYMPI|nr:Pka-R2 [Symbiodinium pilosum]
MVEISYRFTFLDVLCEDEERAQDTRAGRALSEPPISHGHSWRSPEEAELFTYVRSLPIGISEQAPDATHRAWEPSEQPHPESITGEGSDLNVGSLGHPVLCKRPCMHVAAGRQCEAGAACDFCHLCDGQSMRLDKQQRRMVADMPKATFLHAALQLLQDKARNAHLCGPEAIFNILEDELRSGNQSRLHPPAELPRRLLRGLRHANFTAVASLAAQKCSEDGRTQMYEALQELRTAC